MDAERLRMHTQDFSNREMEMFRACFPECLTEVVNEEGTPSLAVDIKKLQELLNINTVSEAQEHYVFTWPNKRNAIREANTPTNLALRPLKAQSVNFYDTQNIYIQGENLEVLKLLRETYLGKIKMIYIDPPYNTGGEFVYSDNYSSTIKNFRDKSAMFDQDGNMLLQNYEQNTENNGRFHTDWLNMMYPRLRVAKDLLSEKGVIIISIDDNEVHNLRKICDEIFGERNFIAQCVRKRRDSQANLSKNISPIHEYLVIYGKTNGDILNKVSANIDLDDYKNPDNDPRGPYKTMPCTNKGGAVYSVTTPTGRVITEEWRFKRETYDNLYADNRIVFPKGGEGKPRYKLFLSEKQEIGVLANTWLDDTASNQTASREIKELFNDLVFDTPKPVGLLQFCLQLASDKDSLILDFFSGSATTAHAVIKQNAEDGGTRRFILVQIPERVPEKSNAFKVGFKDLCEIGEERIRRAGKKILSEMKSEFETGGLFAVAEGEKPKLDIGFRVFKLDSSNMEDVYYKPEDSSETSLFEDNVKPDRTPEDLLFQVMLECNLPLSAKIETERIADKEVFSVNNGYLIACFDEDVNEEMITAVAKRKPHYFIMRDKSLSSDNVADNFEQIFQAYSKDTIRRIL